MTRAWLIHRDTGVLVAPGKVLSAAGFEQLVEADNVLAVARQRAEALLRDAHQQRENLERIWREAAFMNAQADLEQAIESLQRQFRHFEAQVRAALCDAVLACLMKLLGDAGDHAAVVRRVEAAVQELLDEVPLDIHVSPLAFRQVSEALSQNDKTAGTQIRVHQDNDLSGPDFMAVTSNHCLDGRLSEWAKGLREAVSAALEQTSHARHRYGAPQ
jgi:flagellar biosynthesis/type III secretory pathway protein FliH